MFNRLIFSSFLIILFLISCDNKSSHQLNSYKAIVIGKITNDTSYSIINLSSYLGEIAGDTKKYPDKNGEFTFILRLPSEFEFNIAYNEMFATLLINPGDSIFIKINPKDSSSFSFSGTNSKMHNEIYNLDRNFSKTNIPYSELIQRYKKDTPEDYLKFKTSLYNDNLRKLNDFLDETECSTKVKNFYRSKYLVNYCSDLLIYLNMASIYQGIVQTRTGIPEIFLNTIDSLYRECMDDFHLRDYHNFIASYSQLFNFENYDSIIFALKNKDKLLVSRLQLDYVRNNITGFQKDYLLVWHLKSLIENGYITEEIIKEYYDDISMNYFQSFLNKRYYEYKQVLNLEADLNHIHLADISNSDTISLFDEIRRKHPGKILYVDIWGTWCGSCISKFAYLPELRKVLDKDNIEFLFLAIYSPKDQWEKVIKYHKPEGYHYLLNKKQTTELYNRVDVSGIPHYFIINKKGKIEIQDAKGPDDPQLKRQIVSIK